MNNNLGVRKNYQEIEEIFYKVKEIEVELQKPDLNFIKLRKYREQINNYVKKVKQINKNLYNEEELELIKKVEVLKSILKIVDTNNILKIAAVLTILSVILLNPYILIFMLLISSLGMITNLTCFFNLQINESDYQSIIECKNNCEESIVKGLTNTTRLLDFIKIVYKRIESNNQNKNSNRHWLYDEFPMLNTKCNDSYEMITIIELLLHSTRDYEIISQIPLGDGIICFLVRMYGVERTSVFIGLSSLDIQEIVNQYELKDGKYDYKNKNSKELNK